MRVDAGVLDVLVGHCVGLKEESEVVKDERDRGVGEECEFGLSADLPGRGSGSLEAPDGKFGMFKLGKKGVIEEINGNSVDGDECWCEGGDELEDSCKTKGLREVVKNG